MPSYICIRLMVTYPQLLMTYLSSEGHGTAGKQVAVVSMCGEQAELGLVDEGEKVLDLLLQGDLILVLLGVGVGGLGAGVCVAEGRHGECLWGA